MATRRAKRRRKNAFGLTAKPIVLDPVRYAPPQMRLEILARDGFCCRYCSRPITVETANIDHVVPYHKGGPTKPHNLVAACWLCNKAKGGSSRGFTAFEVS